MRVDDVRTLRSTGVSCDQIVKTPRVRVEPRGQRVRAAGLSGVSISDLDANLKEADEALLTLLGYRRPTCTLIPEGARLSVATKCE